MEHILVQEDRSGKQMETGARRGLQRKGGPMFPKIGKKKHACYIIHDTNLAGKGVMKAKIIPSFWEPLRCRISGQQNYGKEYEL